MRIGFTGAQGTGKSTLLKNMFGWPSLDGHAFISGLTRFNAKTRGAQINEQGNFEGQKTLANSMGWHLKTLQNLVVDRTMLDIYAYTVYMRDHGKLNTQELNYIRNRARKYQCLFDVVFYIRPEFTVVEDGVRSADRGFATAIAGLMENIISLEPLGTKQVVTLSGSVTQRLDTIETWIKTHEHETNLRCNSAGQEAPANEELTSESQRDSE